MVDFLFSSKPEQISKSALIIAKRIFGETKSQNILLVGKNEISNTILKNFQNEGIKTCKKLINKEQKSKFLNNITFYLKSFDIIITSFKSDKILITKEKIIEGLKYRKQKPIFLIDSNIPGNIELDSGSIDNCFLFDLNDLEQFNQKDSPKILADDYISNNDDEFFDNLDSIMPEISSSLNLKPEKVIFLEKKLNEYIKIKKSNGKKIEIFNFLKFLIK